MKVTVMDVIWPLAVLMTANLIALICWTTIDPLVFRRTYHAGTDDWNRRISSYGTCTSSGNAKGGMWPYLAIIIAVNMGALILANVQSYQARSIRTEFSESKYISIIMASMLQAFVIAIPILALVFAEPQVMFVILVCLISVICTAVLLLMFVPKIQYLKEWGREQERKRVSKRLRLANGGGIDSSELPSTGTVSGGQGLKVDIQSYNRPLEGHGDTGTTSRTVSTNNNGYGGASGLKVKVFSSTKFFRSTKKDRGTSNDNEELGLKVDMIESPQIPADSENLLSMVEENEGPCENEDKEGPCDSQDETQRQENNA